MTDVSREETGACLDQMMNEVVVLANLADKCVYLPVHNKTRQFCFDRLETLRSEMDDMMSRLCDQEKN